MNQAMSITVLIPAYEAQSTINRALESVRSQSLRPDQILIVDDGSQSPLQVVAPDLPVTLVRLAQNMGSSAALNYGLSLITTEWVAFLDADDSWHPQKLEKQTACARANPDVALIATGLRFVDSDGKKNRDVATEALPDEQAACFAALLEDCVIGKPSVLARTRRLREMGGFDPKLVVGEDQHMWLRLAAAHQVKIVSEILTFAHDTPGSLSKRRDLPPDYLWLNVIQPLVAQHSALLSAQQCRRIIGARAQQAAVAHLRRGSYAQAIRYLWVSSRQGYQCSQNLHYALTPLKFWRY